MFDMPVGPSRRRLHLLSFCFFFNDTATTEIYTLSLHDALPICHQRFRCHHACTPAVAQRTGSTDRKSTRLNSSHVRTSYAVFCLKKKINSRHAFAPPALSRRPAPNYYCVPIARRVRLTFESDLT